MNRAPERERDELMRTRPIAYAFLFACAAFTAFVEADRLSVGDAAPSLKGAKWIAGDPIESFKTGKTHVVEFWSSQDRTSKAALLHLSALAESYPDIEIIAASVFEKEKDTAALATLVAAMGREPGFRILTDSTLESANGELADRWMGGIERSELPTTFVVNGDGRIAWIGSAEENEEALVREIERAAATGHSGATNKSDQADDAINRSLKELADSQKDYDQHVMPLVQVGDYDAAITQIDVLIKAHPGRAALLLAPKFGLLMESGQDKEAYLVADEYAALIDKDADRLNELAWFILDDASVKERDVERAMRFAKRAAELSQRRNGAILDTLARAHFEMGDVDQAIELQKLALEVADEREKSQLQQALTRYEAALPK